MIMKSYSDWFEQQLMDPVIQQRAANTASGYWDKVADTKLVSAIRQVFELGKDQIISAFQGMSRPKPQIQRPQQNFSTKLSDYPTGRRISAPHAQGANAGRDMWNKIKSYFSMRENLSLDELNLLCEKVVAHTLNEDANALTAALDQMEKSIIKVVKDHEQGMRDHSNEYNKKYQAAIEELEQELNRVISEKDAEIEQLKQQMHGNSMPDEVQEKIESGWDVEQIANHLGKTEEEVWEIIDKLKTRGGFKKYPKKKPKKT